MSIFGVIKDATYVKSDGGLVEVLLEVYDDRFKKSMKPSGANQSLRVLVEKHLWFNDMIYSGLYVQCNSDSCHIDEPMKIKIKRGSIELDIAQSICTHERNPILTKTDRYGICKECGKNLGYVR